MESKNTSDDKEELITEEQKVEYIKQGGIDLRRAQGTLDKLGLWGLQIEMVVADAFPWLGTSYCEALQA
jgi:hypothetical protein